MLISKNKDLVGEDMNRFTSNKSVEKMGMYELAHNSCYIDKYGCARYRDFETDVDARELARDLMREYDLWDDDDDAMLSDDAFDDEIMDNLMYDIKDIQGMIALFYRNLWVMAELREALKVYEDAEEQGLLLRLPVLEGTEVYQIGEVYPFEDDGKPFYSMCIERFNRCMIEEYGKTTFLTKYEAEKALAELQSK